MIPSCMLELERRTYRLVFSKVFVLPYTCKGLLGPCFLAPSPGAAQAGGLDCVQVSQIGVKHMHLHIYIYAYTYAHVDR